MNKLGISINQTNVEMIPAYAAAGFEVMEISLPNKPHEEIVALGERALELAKECGMELWSVHIPFGRSLEISSIDEAKRLNVLSMLMPSVALAKEWGAQVLVVHASSEPNEPSSRPARILACAESLKTLQQAAAPVRIALENLPRTCIGRESCEVVPLAKYCSGVCFDVNHLLIESHEDFMKAAAPFIITTSFPLSPRQAVSNLVSARRVCRSESAVPLSANLLTYCAEEFSPPSQCILRPE